MPCGPDVGSPAPPPTKIRASTSTIGLPNPVAGLTDNNIMRSSGCEMFGILHPTETTPSGSVPPENVAVIVGVLLGGEVGVGVREGVRVGVTVRVSVRVLVGDGMIGVTEGIIDGVGVGTDPVVNASAPQVDIAE